MKHYNVSHCCHTICLLVTWLRLTLCSVTIKSRHHLFTCSLIWDDLSRQFCINRFYISARMNHTIICLLVTWLRLTLCSVTMNHTIICLLVPRFGMIGISFTSVLYQPFSHFCENEPHHHLFTCHLTQADLSSMRMNHSTICLLESGWSVSLVRMNHTTVYLLVTWVRVIWYQWEWTTPAFVY